MSGKKYKKSYDKDKKRYVYIGDYYSKDNNFDNVDQSYKIDLLTRRLNLLESILTSNQIIKAKPVLSIISGNMNCLNKINDIYNNWITYLSYVSRTLKINYNVYELFWQLDFYIFHQYFYSLVNNNNNNNQYIIEFVNVNLEYNYSEEQYKIIKSALYKNRNKDLKLLYPHHKEYISITIRENRIFLVYFEDELYKIINHNDDYDMSKKDFQFQDGKIHSDLSFNKDFTGEVEINALNLVNNSNNNNNNNNNNDDDENVFEFSNLVDKRQLILQNKKPLYNTLIDVNILNKLNSTLFRLNPVLLNLSLIIFHAMLHIKRDIVVIDNYNYDSCFPHDSFFMKEYVNYTPSALYGHAMIPPLTLS